MNPIKTSVVCAAFVAASTHAGEMESTLEMEVIELDPVVVVASKRPRPLSSIVGQVTVIDSAFIEQHLVENGDDLLRYEPGINLEGSGTRFAANSVNIRGIGGNRVAIEIDGVPVRDRFAIGNFSSAAKILADTDRIKRLEILHGPASTLYGSDALGGVMSITTWDPDDLIATGNGNSHFSLRSGYQGANSAMVYSGLAALGNDRNGIIFAATWRDGHELENQASDDAPRDLQDWNSRDYFLRFTHDTGNGNRMRFTVDDFSRDVKSDIRSLPGTGRFRNTTSLTGDDSDRNRRLAFDYEFTTTLSEGVVRLYDVASSTRQLTSEERASGAHPLILERRFHYDQDFRGLELDLFRNFTTTGSEHRLGAGIEFQRSDSTELRDGYQLSLVDGSVTNTILGENFPVRDFPPSRTDELGIFVQDEISLGNGKWELVPALRYEHYRLDPKPDEIYLEDNQETEVVAITEDHFSPRIGVLYQFNKPFSVYAQYVNGFRAPPFEDANIGLDIPLFNIRAIPNPNLKSEKSHGFETGLRYLGNSGSFTLAIFDTHYEDFIETKARIGVDSETGTLLFQSRNIEKARIYGLDLRLHQDLEAWSHLLTNWSLDLSAYWSRGKNEENGQPLNSVSPPQAVLGISWYSANGLWDAGLTGTFTAAQNRIDETSGERFHTPSWATMDLVCAWHLNRHLDLRAGVYNLTDKTYWRWSDVSIFNADNPMIELLSRPGRNYSISLRVQW